MKLSRHRTAPADRKFALWIFFLCAMSARLSAALSISVENPPNPAFPNQYAPGSSLTLKAARTPGQTGDLQWLKDGSPISGATSTTLTLNSLTQANTGNYQARETTAGVTTYSEQTLTLNVVPFPATPVDTIFTTQLPAGTTPRVISFFSDGSLLVAATSNTSGNRQIIRLQSNGSRDLSFSFPSTAGDVLAVLPDDSIVVSKYPFRLHTNGTSFPLTLPPAFDATKPLTAASAQAGGKLLLAQGPLLARLNADESLDATFNYTAAANSSVEISNLQTDTLGRVYVKGRFQDPTPGNFPSSWDVYFRVLPTGARDTNFARQDPLLLRGSLLVTPLADGRIFSYGAFHGARSWQILKDDGTPDAAWTGTAEFTEGPVIVDSLRNDVYLADTLGIIHRYTIGVSGLVKDSTFYAGTGVVERDGLALAPDGKLIAKGRFTQWDGHASPHLVRLRTTDIAGTLPPKVAVFSSTSTPRRGDTLTIQSSVTSAGTVTYQWLALDGQPLPAITTSDKLVIPNFSAAHFGRYQLRATGPGGTILSSVFTAQLSHQLPYLANLSGRAMTGTGENTVIGGFATKVHAGALGVSTLLRGGGPVLRPFGVNNFLSNPAINVYNTLGQLLANNDQWHTNPSTAELAAAIGAHPFEQGSYDAALAQNFHNANATLHLVSQDGTSGIGLLEIYRRFEDSAFADLMNLSFRARTAPGEETAIAGFVIVDPQDFGRSAKLLLRAVGPTLANSGIIRPLTNPILTVYNSKGQVVAQNDDWPSHLTAEVTPYDAATNQVGAFSLPYGSKDAGLLVDLPAGAYSMHATGGTGVVLLEVYLVR